MSFIKLLQNEPNLLLLDEPTNHLDIYSIEILEDALEQFDGTMLLVSHNRHFLNSVCNTIYILDENGLRIFKGNYDDYKESLNKKNNITTNTDSKLSYEKQKEQSRRIAKLKKDTQNVESRCSKINEDIKILEEQMFDKNISTDVEKLMKIQDNIKKLKDEEQELLIIWEQYTLELEEINE